MKIILHADDFGYDKDTCEATISAFEKGLLKSASIMPTSPAVNLAIEYAKKHPEYSFGVHLTFVDGLKSATSHNKRTMTDESGKFYDSGTIRNLALRLQIPTNEILKEMLAQINILEASGIKVSHVDSHGHLHKFPSFLIALKKLRMIRPELKVRRVQNIYLSTPSAFSPSFWLNRIFDKCISNQHVTTDYFYMPANNFDTDWAPKISEMIQTYPAKSILEIGVHPGFAEQWRNNELTDLAEFCNLIKESRQHQIISWAEING